MMLSISFTAFCSLLSAIFYAEAVFAIYPWAHKPGEKLYGSSFAFPGNATYDYVIVGGGTAGLVVAKRLSEDPSLSIAVIEAGNFYELSNGNYSQIPFYYPRFQTGNLSDIQPAVDWEIIDLPQPVWLGPRNNSPHI
jgi:choline dehydrogenase